MRHRCRNPRCGCKLRSPTDNPRNAFCCRGCFAGYYRSRCIVCERTYGRAREDQHTCGRRKCKSEFRRHRLRFLAKWGQTPVEALSPLGNPIKSGTKTGTENGRGWRQVAGPVLTATSLRYASLSLDLHFAARLDRAHADYFENRRKAKRRAQLKAQFKRHHAPLNLLGGFRFANVPSIDLSPIETPETAWAVTSRWRPCATPAADFPELPEFLDGRAPSSLRRAA
jgi:hypothetical protein